MKIFEEELWLSNGLRVRCGSTGPKGAEGDESRTFWEIEDLAGTNLHASVLYYDKDKLGTLAKKVILEFEGDSDMQTFTDALEFSVGKLRSVVYGEDGTVESRLRKGMQDVLEALVEYCNVFSDLPEGEVPECADPLSALDLDMIKQQFVKSNLSALVQEEEWREKNLGLDTVAFLNRVHVIVPRMLQMIHQQSALIRGLRKIPLDELMEENKILREWFEESQGDLSITCGVSQRVSLGQPPAEEKALCALSLKEPVAEESASVVKERVETVYASVLRVLPDHTYPFNGFTSQEIADELGRVRSSISPELSKLVRQGKVVVWSTNRQVMNADDGEIEVTKIDRSYMKAPKGLAEDRVLTFLKNVKLQLPSETVATAVGLRPGSAYSCLYDLYKRGHVNRVGLPGQRTHLYWAVLS